MLTKSRHRIVLGNMRMIGVPVKLLLWTSVLPGAGVVAQGGRLRSLSYQIAGLATTETPYLSKFTKTSATLTQLFSVRPRNKARKERIVKVTSKPTNPDASGPLIPT